MVEVSLTVGKLDASLALLLTKDHHLIEFPTILLPDGISTGSIVKINCERDLKKEEEEDTNFENLQEEIYNTFGKNEPKSPILKVLNITQTSCVLEWEPLELGTSDFKSLTLYKNGSKLGQIKNPSSKKNIKLSGLPVDTEYNFQLRLDTTAGIYHSNKIDLKTHKMTDLSGITICIGEIDYSDEPFTIDNIEDSIVKISAKPTTKSVKIDTTQFICTKRSGPEFEKAKNMNIPIIRPEWLKACELERRIVGVNKFYLDVEPAIWKQRDFWKKEPKQSTTPVISTTSPPPTIDDTTTIDKETPPTPPPKDSTPTTGVPAFDESQDTTTQKADNTIDPKDVFEEEPIDDKATPTINIESVNATDTMIKVATAEEAATEPTAEESATEPTVEESTFEQTTEEPSLEEPSIEEPATEEPSVEEPSVEEPSVEERSTKKSFTEELAAKELVSGEPKTAVLTAEESTNTEERLEESKSVIQGPEDQEEDQAEDDSSNSATPVTSATEHNNTNNKTKGGNNKKKGKKGKKGKK